MLLSITNVVEIYWVVICSWGHHFECIQVLTTETFLSSKQKRSTEKLDKNAGLIHPVVKQTIINEPGKSSKIKQGFMAKWCCDYLLG